MECCHSHSHINSFFYPQLFDPYWPQSLDQPTHYDDFTVNCVKHQQLSHCTEFQLKLSMHGADAILDLSLLQLKQWTKAYAHQILHISDVYRFIIEIIYSSTTQLLGIAQNALQTHQERCLSANAPTSPLIINCLTGSERSELVIIGICALMGTQTKRATLISKYIVYKPIYANVILSIYLTDVVDVWSRICMQRQNSLRDAAILEQSMQIIVSHAHDVLNKRKNILLESLQYAFSNDLLVC